MNKPVTSIEMFSGDDLIVRIDRQDDGRFVVEVGATKQTAPSPLLAVGTALHMLDGAE